MVILVQRSRRPRRWAGVALFAAILISVLYVEHHGVTRLTVGDSNKGIVSLDSFESVLQRPGFGTIDHSAQLTDFASSNSTSTEGETPTK